MNIEREEEQLLPHDIEHISFKARLLKLNIRMRVWFTWHSSSLLCLSDETHVIQQHVEHNDSRHVSFVVKFFS